MKKKFEEENKASGYKRDLTPQSKHTRIIYYISTLIPPSPIIIRVQIENIICYSIPVLEQYEDIKVIKNVELYIKVI